LTVEDRSKALYQPWNQEAFIGDIFVRTMTSIQRWMYTTLLHEAFFYSTRPDLPDDDDLLWRLAGCETREQWDSNKDVVRARFQADTTSAGAAVLWQPRLRADWQRVQDSRAKRSERAQKGGMARAKKARAAGKRQPRTQRPASTDDDGGGEAAQASLCPPQAAPRKLEVTKEVKVSKVSKASKKGSRERGGVKKRAAPAHTHSLTRSEEHTQFMDGQEVLFQALESRCLRLGLRAEPRSFEDIWKTVAILEDIYGAERLLTDFDAWATAVDIVTLTSSKIPRPIGEWSKQAGIRIQNLPEPPEHKEAKRLAKEMAYTLSGTVTLSDQQINVVAAQIREHGVGIIESVMEQKAGSIQNALDLNHTIETLDALAYSEKRRRIEAWAETLVCRIEKMSGIDTFTAENFHNLVQQYKVFELAAAFQTFFSGIDHNDPACMDSVEEEFIKVAGSIVEAQRLEAARPAESEEAAEAELSEDTL